MKKLSGLVVAIMLGLTVSAQTDPDFVPLKELFKNDFLAGVAVNGRSITGDAGKMVISNFNTLTCENEMKPQSLLYFPFQRPVGGPQGQNAQQRPANAPQGGQQNQPPQGEQAPPATPGQRNSGGMIPPSCAKGQNRPQRPPTMPVPTIQTVSLDEISMSDPYSEGNGPRKPQIYEIDDSGDKLVQGKRYNP